MSYGYMSRGLAIREEKRGKVDSEDWKRSMYTRFYQAAEVSGERANNRKQGRKVG